MGVFCGLAMATCFSAWVLLLVLLRGSPWFDKYQMSAWQIVAAYYAAGLLGGLVFGVLWPLSRTSWGAVVLGSLIGVIAYAAVGMIMHGALSWQSVHDGMVLGVPIGGFVGYRVQKAP
jgi:hypothetical protein